MRALHIVDRAPLATAALAELARVALSPAHGARPALEGESSWRPTAPWSVDAHTEVERALAALAEGGCGVLVVGLELLEAQGGLLFQRYRAADPALQVLVLTETNNHDATVRAIARHGAVFHLGRPYEAFDVAAKLRNAAERHELAAAAADARLRLSAVEGSLTASERRARETEAALRSTHDELETATERLVAAEQLAAVGRVAGGIAHELTRQLTLVGYAEAIKSRVAHDPELVELAETIVCAHKRIAAMVDEIRDFAAAEPAPSYREPADVCAVIEDALTLLRYDRDLARRSLRCEFRARPLAELDRTKFSQVVLNLVHNAVLATADGAEIVLEVTEHDPQTAQLRVIDRGVGMSAEVVGRLGEPFFTTRGARGSGLGVGICARIVEAHGGTLRFESAPGVGTAAIVTLPQIPPRATKRRS